MLAGLPDQGGCQEGRKESILAVNAVQGACFDGWYAVRNTGFAPATVPPTNALRDLDFMSVHIKLRNLRRSVRFCVWTAQVGRNAKEANRVPNRVPHRILVLRAWGTRLRTRLGTPLVTRWFHVYHIVCKRWTHAPCWYRNNFLPPAPSMFLANVCLNSNESLHLYPARESCF